MLSDEAYARAVRLTSSPPSRAEAAGLASRVALIFGGALCLSGVVFFFAHNWAGMSRWQKFGVLELGVLGFAAAAWVATGQLNRQVALTLCAATLGPLLAVYGQTYQTGADPYELFLSWALLAAPLAALSRFVPLWAGVWLLLDLTASLWCEQLQPFGGAPWRYEPLVLAALNLAGLAACEWVSRRTRWLGPTRRWPRRALALGVVLPPLPLACGWLIDHWFFTAGPWGAQACVASAVACAGLALLYPRDRFMRTTAAFAGVALLTSLSTHWVWAAADRGATWLWLLHGLFVVVELTLCIGWVRRVEVKS
ncbi:MAG: DUF2157 domain-containing protein [Archangiaceae bacterium]|nr:DUF2157 domain-containing protein [Archangiaceae bacterium]